MNKKGQLAVGGILLAAVGIIIGLVLVTDSIADNTAYMTNTRTINNYTIASLTVAPITLQGKYVTINEIYNASDETYLGLSADNYTVKNNVILSDGTLGATIQAVAGKYVNRPTNISYTYQPLGYVTDGAGRAMVNLIVVFCAIAIFVVALTPTLRNGVLDLAKRV